MVISMSRTIDQPIHPGTKAKPPGVNDSGDESTRECLAALQAHLTPENAQVLRERLRTVDRDAKAATDWDKNAFLKRLKRHR